MANDIVQPGIYNVEYFSGSQVGIFIGDIWIDEVTSMQYSVSQSKQPIYGYADTFFRTMSNGQVIVQGSFTINFKEAGYLWLVLNKYRDRAGLGDLMNPIKTSSEVTKKNIEQFVDGETDTYADRNQLLSNLAAQAALTGFASNARLDGTAVRPDLLDIQKEITGSTVGHAENEFEAFEDLIWIANNQELDEQDRRADDPRLNGFDIYIAFGDYAGDNRHNHTIQKITNVHIMNTSKVIEVSGMPLQESYFFIGRNLV